MQLFSFLLLCLTLFACAFADDPSRLPTRCEVCKYLANELNERLTETNKKEVIDLGTHLDGAAVAKKRISYRSSEMRLIEVMEGVCEKILQYNVHAERKGSLRYAKGQSETMQTLHGLVNKGVKVDLGIPFELWDSPSVEVTNMKKYCDQMLEEHEEDIEEWYYNHFGTIPIEKYLCDDRVLTSEDKKSCLSETFVPGAEDEDEEDEMVKGDKGKPGRASKEDL